MSNAMPTELGAVASLWRYPVKSMMGEELNTTEITEQGCSEIGLMRWWTALMRSLRPPRTPENGPISSTSGLPSLGLRASARTCLRSELLYQTAL
jgi:hypothetical protein